METKATLRPVPVADSRKEVKICIVDDDTMYRKVLEHQLKDHPEYKIYSFKSGEDCFRNFKIIDPDIVILDYQLNESDPRAMNGLETLKSLKGIKPEISVLMVSGQASFDVVGDSIKYGAFGYIVKNENASKKLDNSIGNILRQVNLKKNNSEVKSYFNMLMSVGVLIITLPAVLQYYTPSWASWITIGLFTAYFILVTIVTNTKFSDKKIE